MPPGSESINLSNYTQRKHTTLSTPRTHTTRHNRGVGKGKKLEVETLSGACFLALLSLQIAIGRFPGKGKCTARLVAMDLLFAKIYMCLVI